MDEPDGYILIITAISLTNMVQPRVRDKVLLLLNKEMIVQTVVERHSSEHITSDKSYFGESKQRTHL